MTETRYISTRGEAPVLGFEDVVLAGLARDGGLYMPEVWPRLERDEIADFAGRPFHEVAAAVIAPFAAGALSRDELTALAREAYAGFGHAATTPLVQLAPGPICARTVPRPDARFQGRGDAVSRRG